MAQGLSILLFTNPGTILTAYEWNYRFSYSLLQGHDVWGEICNMCDVNQSAKEKYG